MSTVRISTSSQRTLRQLSEQAGEPMQTILDRAIEEYRRKCLLEETNQAYQALRTNDKAWKAELEERALWDAALADNLDA